MEVFMLAQKSRHDPVDLVENMLTVALFLLGDPEASKPSVSGYMPVLLLNDLRIIIYEYRYMSLEGEVRVYETIWDKDREFGKIMHGCMRDAHQKYFPKEDRADLLHIVSTAIKSISHTPPQIPEGENISRLTGFFRHMKRTAAMYRENRQL